MDVTLTSSIFQTGLGRTSSHLALSLFPCFSAQPIDAPSHSSLPIAPHGNSPSPIFPSPGSVLPQLSFPGFTTLSFCFPRPRLALSTPLASYSSHPPACSLLLSLLAETPPSIFPPGTPLTSAPGYIYSIIRTGRTAVVMGSELLHEFAAFEAAPCEHQHFLEACGDTGKSSCQTKSAGIPDCDGGSG